MKRKLLFALLFGTTFCIAQTNLIQNGTFDLFTVTSDDVTNNPGWTRNDTDNADAFDMTPPSSVIYDADAMSTGATSSSPYAWSNSSLDAWLDTTFGDDSEQPASSSDGNFVGGVATRGVKINEAGRRLYQRVAVTSGTSYTLILESRSEAMNVDSEVFILNTEIADEVGLTSTSSTVDSYLLIDNDFNSSKSNATTNNFTTNSLEFTPSGSFIIVYIKASSAINSSTEVFYDNIELYETSTLSIDENFASAFKLYPNPTSDIINISSSNDVQLKSVKLYDTLGKEVYTSLTEMSSINVSNFTKGVYFLKLEAEDKIATKRILVN